MENFVVSARKYRPATFASVVGQKHITSTLRNAIERGQLAHAYLFCGPRGVGKTTCARIFAKAINCLQPEAAEACNRCESCRSFNEGRSLNIHELDAASNNSVEDIRTLIEQVRILPQGGRYSVFIIDEVHMLSTAAFNAFLKTLEEPPAHAVFILATTEKHKIIPTILSRCQIYDFNRIRVEDSVEYLRHIASQEGVEADEESLNLIAQKADGGMRDALSMFDKAVSFCGRDLRYQEVAQTLNVLDYDTYFRMTDTLLAGDYLSALLAFDEVLARGFSGQLFMAGLNRHLRDLLVARSEATLRLLEFTGTLMERYRTQAAACPPEFLFGAISLLTDLDGKIRQSSNGRLLVELGLMKIAGLGQKKNNPADPLAAPLPELCGTTPAPSDSQPPAARPAAPKPVATSAASAAPAAKAPVAAAAAPAKEAERTEAPSATVRCSRPAPEAAEAAPPARMQPEPAATPPTESAARPRPSRLASGFSLSELISGNAPETAAAADDQAPRPTAAATIDPRSAEKLEAARPRILALVRESRPRFVAAFEPMKFRGHAILIAVASEALREEILRNRTELLLRIAESAGIEGMLELEVTVSEEIRAARPIKLEDRVRHMTEKNPLLVELRRALDLETE
ncbi:MAG: DNA polymerase III subunit gamma/tau [Alistipes sp.]|nr:DNA polymerase III subunit gamma/tau [Alistipes sp.]